MPNIIRKEAEKDLAADQLPYNMAVPILKVLNEPSIKSIWRRINAMQGNPMSSPTRDGGWLSGPGGGGSDDDDNDDDGDGEDRLYLTDDLDRADDTYIPDLNHPEINKSKTVLRKVIREQPDYYQALGDKNLAYRRAFENLRAAQQAQDKRQQQWNVRRQEEDVSAYGILTKNPQLRFLEGYSKDNLPDIGEMPDEEIPT